MKLKLPKPDQRTRLQGERLQDKPVRVVSVDCVPERAFPAVKVPWKPVVDVGRA
jgi:hypothetical protein